MMNSQYLREWVLALAGWLACSAAYAGDLVSPDPSITPAEVVAIQLMGLKNNDLVDTDSGIRQTWNFAHPKNRNATGPFPRFAQMLKGPDYSALLDHKSHEIRNGLGTSKGKTGDGEIRKQFDVLLETEKGDILYFSWIVQKVAAGQFKDCWMTISVSVPRPVGQSG